MRSPRVARASRIALVIAALGSATLPSCLPPASRTVRRRTQTTPRRIAPLGVNDVFAVRVFNEAELSQEYRVAEDGTIDFPYLGRIPVAGREATEVADGIQRALREREILVNPQVSVMIRQVNSRRVSIFGQVTRPGTQDYAPGMDVVQAISAAGGFTALANRNAVRVTRRGSDGSTRTFLVRVDEITEGRSENVELEPGDIVFVPESMA